MANFNKHLGAGIVVAAFYILVRASYDPDFTLIDKALGIMTLPLFAVISDVDQAHSKSRKLLITLTLTLIIVLALLGKNAFIIILAFVLLLVILFSKHRGFMHSVGVGAVLAAFTGYYNIIYAVFAFLSFMTHIIIDRTTKQNKFPYKNGRRN